MNTPERQKFDINDYFTSPEQILAWELVTLKIAEMLKYELKGRILLDIQAGRINSVFPQPQIAGTSQLLFYIERVKL